VSSQYEHGPDFQTPNEALIATLTAEVERLKAVTNCYADEQQKQLHDLKAAEAEVERLREALEQIANTYDASWGVGNIARAALEAKP
jgi:hypothetical protein